MYEVSFRVKVFTLDEIEEAAEDDFFHLRASLSFELDVKVHRAFFAREILYFLVVRHHGRKDASYASSD